MNCLKVDMKKDFSSWGWYIALCLLGPIARDEGEKDEDSPSSGSLMLLLSKGGKTCIKFAAQGPRRGIVLNTHGGFQA